ncbi:membrane protein [Shinella sp. SUS2]|uniref:AI-2E family transporter n=1 Tax=unclassified Shinella TaxID=2643062 RepID=UPI00068212B0|nr:MULTISPECIES: AI-2E family transporter [unclassified Shinella]ANH08788.1 AI-2E family transporter [Shinella sp. HZN7]KNY12888.1 membrane protein [Shinella sp. SUS2]KOC71477.1 hypothetical protein AKG10_32835 [Shinella sp. GWS1]MDG4676132.1 AI-2E family transporter [Shinella sp. 838]
MSVQKTCFYFILSSITVAFIWLLLPYYSAIFWAMVLAIVFYPVQEVLVRSCGGKRNIAALLTVVICVCLVIVPSFVILGSLVQEGSNLYRKLSTEEFDIAGYVTNLHTILPAFLKDWLASLQIGSIEQIREKISTAALQASQLVATHVFSFGQNTLQLFVSFGITLYLLFFLFRDGPEIGRTFRKAMPLSDDHAEHFLRKFTAVVQATIKGNVIIALTQGAVGGLVFWALGIQAALLWGMVMAFFSMLPAVGAAIVWIPAAIWLILSGMWIKGLILILVGVFVIGLIDNLLRPPLVGKGTHLPDYVILVSTVGGMSLFGINGFVIGPLIAAMFIAAWSLFAKEQEIYCPRPDNDAAPALLNRE